MVRIGMIGCGRISARHADTIAGLESAELAAVYDVEAARMSAAIGRYASHSPERTPPRAYASPEAMLADPAIEAVVVAAPSWLHAKYALAALRAGKHVLIEKPLALSLRDGLAIRDCAERSALAVQVCHPLRYRPVMREVKRLAAERKLGKLLLGSVKMRLNRGEQYYRSASWRGTWDKDGGMLLNQGAHLIDLLLWWMGEPNEAFGLLARGSFAKDTEDAVAGAYRFASGAVGSVEALTIAQPDNYDNEIALFGERGTICIGGIGLTDIRRWTTEERQAAPLGMDSADGHRDMYAHWIARMRGKAGELVEPADALRSLAATFALYESARRRRPVSLPLASFDAASMRDAGFDSREP